MKYIFFILIFILISQIFSSEDICWETETEDKFCFGQGNSFSDHSFFHETKEKIYDELNNWILKTYNEAASKCDVVDNGNLVRSFKMNKREFVRDEETLFKVNARRTLNSDIFNEDIYISSTNIIENYKGLPNLQHLSPESKLTLGLLHHLYFIEKSPLKLWLRVLPFGKIPNFANISKALIAILRDDPIYEEIYKLRAKIIQDYLDVKNVITQWPKEIRENVLNNREEITINDWVSSYFLVLKENWLLENTLHLVPGPNFAKYEVLIENNEQYMKYPTHFLQTHIKIADNSIYLLAPKVIKVNEDLTDSFDRFGYINSLFIHNQKEKNPSECIEIKIISKEDFQILKRNYKLLLNQLEIESHSICVIDFLYSMKKIKAFRNILNMGEQEVETCLEGVKNRKDSNNVDKIDFVIGKCKVSELKLAKSPEEDEVFIYISKIITNYKEKLNKLEEFLNEKGYDVIKYYLSKRLEIAKKIEDYIKNMIKKEYKNTEDKKSEL